MPPTRILMVCARYLPDMGGIETHVYEVARRLAATGEFEITVLTTDRTRSRLPSEIVDGVHIIRTPAWPKNRDYYYAPAVADVVSQRQRWDLIHCQGIHTLVPILAMRAALRTELPYAVTFHTGGHSLRHRNALRTVQWRLIGPLLRRADSLIAVSRFEAEQLGKQAHLGDKSVSVVRNGGTLPVPPPETRIVPGRIISLGRLERYKGHQRAIEALPYIMRQVPAAHLHVIGKGPYEAELRSLAGRLGVSDRVSIRYIEPANRIDMAAALAEASVVVAFSDYEAHPVAVMEALSVGRPVVGYACAGIGELVDDGLVIGLSPESPASVAADGVVRAMAQKPARARDDLPTWDTTAEQLAVAYRQVLLGRQDVNGIAHLHRSMTE